MPEASTGVPFTSRGNRRGRSGDDGSLCVLGVDPAAAGLTGYGVIELRGRQMRALRFGALRLPSQCGFEDRLREIHGLIAGLLDEFRPDAIAVEAVFAALNIRTALKLAEVRGVILLAAAQARVPAHSYSPREVKASVTGYGAASKEQMQEMVRMLLGLDETPHPADAADAMAVALCHANAARVQQRLGLPAWNRTQARRDDRAPIRKKAPAREKRTAVRAARGGR